MFGKRIKLFNLLGFTVRIDISWLIVAVLATWALAEGVFPELVKDLSQSTYWLMGLVGAIGLFLSVIFHELCHSLVARKYGIPIKGITLFIFGGVAEMEDEPNSPKSEFMMAIAGPGASILVGLVSLALMWLGQSQGWPPPPVAVLQYLGIINFVLAAFNLVPAFPLDGGRVLRAILWHIKGNLRRATEISSKIGSGFGLLLIFFGILFIVRGAFIGGIWWIFIGLFLRNATKVSQMRMEMNIALRGEQIERFMKENPITVEPSISVEELVDDYIYRHHFKMFPVLEGGRIMGCVTTSEVKQVPREKWGELNVRDIMADCSGDNSLPPHTDAVDALKKMRSKNISRIMVVDGEKLVGIITLKDMLEFIALKMDLEKGTLKDTVEPE